MANCRFHEICGLDADENSGDGLCILHSEKPDKDKEAFDQAFEGHRQKNGDDFRRFVFPGEANFRAATFTRKADFSEAVFTQKADFSDAKFEVEVEFHHAEFEQGACFHKAEFPKGAEFRSASFRGDTNFMVATFTQTANFAHAKFAESVSFFATVFPRGASFYSAVFSQKAIFVRASFVTRFPEDDADDIFGAKFINTMETAKFALAAFTGGAEFNKAVFGGAAEFDRATFGEDATFSDAEFANGAKFDKALFSGRVNFHETQFKEQVSFASAEFSKGANFYRTVFPRRVNFGLTAFLGGTFFVSAGQRNRIFSKAEVDFSAAIIQPLDALTMRDADLRKCKFLGTDLRKAEITGAKWPEKGGRFRVYDEDVQLPEGETREWHHIERLYRELKQNYEERRDYERAGDFHYGEKEMRRQNPETSWGLWFWLTLYRLVSGYGERWLPPLVWSGILLVASTFCYLWWGLLHVKDSILVVDSAKTWETALYSLKVMSLLKPSNFEPVCFWGDLVNTAQSIFGPILIGLFALALRQRLKR
jgi:uncharacterized protein YjbI with pentapeptide repeats